MSPANGLGAELAAAREALRVRGLTQAATFACELYVSLPEDVRGAIPARNEISMPTDGLLVLARAYMETQEYARAAHVLEGKESLNDVEFFVLHYAKYLAGERRKEQLSLEMKTNIGSAVVKPATNPYLPDLLRRLAEADERDELDAFGLYLYGVVLKQSGFSRVSHKSVTPNDILWRSIAKFPWNWSAWTEVASMESPTLSPNVAATWMRELYVANILIVQSQVNEAIETLERLQHTFPSSSYLQSQLARCYYELRDFDMAHELFQQLSSQDPYRLDSMDLYSDVLYVKEAKTALSELAHHMQAVDKYSPQTNCVIGNYYALKGQHERAIAYFTRAVSLDNECLAAWTLIGHEYVQMKNTNAAIEVYRRALEVAPHDYRAWYGLGQAYELLDLNHYSVYYYQKASTIRPYDARMWVALGGSYEKLNQIAQAKSCYLRAVANKDAEGIAVYRLAKLFEEKENDMDKAAQYYRQHLQDRSLRGVTRVDTADAIRAVLFLGKHCMQRGDLVEAIEWCNKLMDRDGPEKEEAKSLLQEIRHMEFFTPLRHHDSKNAK